VSDCLSERPSDWVQHWTHNRSWSYSTVEQALATVPGSEAGKYDVFAYWVAPRTFIDGAWEDLDPDTLFHSDLPPLPAGPGPTDCDVLGFDVVVWGNHQLGCSPLSCNSLAKKFKVNPYCLVDDLEEALRLVAAFGNEACEPGPYLAVRVARVTVAGPEVAGDVGRQEGA
jgi:hypothetical protein